MNRKMSDPVSDGWVVNPELDEIPGSFIAATAKRPIVNWSVHSMLYLASPFSKRVRTALHYRNILRKKGDEGASSVFYFNRKLYLMSNEDKARLVDCRIEPRNLAKLRQSRPDFFSRLVEEGFITGASDALSRRFTTAAIEINTHCNQRCVFCPVCNDPLPKAFMPQDIYEKALQRLVDYGIKKFSVNHFNEPTLDPGLVDKIRLGKDRGLSVQLNTNASLLDEDKIREMAKLGNVTAWINLPSVDPDEFKTLTGSKLLPRILENLKLLHAYGIPTSLCINATTNSSTDKRVAEINREFSKMFGKHVAWRTHDRAGLMNDESSFAPVHHSGRLSGCDHADILCIASDGKVFLCCQDYRQQIVFGNIVEQSIDEIQQNEKTIQVRKWILGFEQPPPDFICTRCALTSPLENNRTTLMKGSEHSHKAIPESLDPGMLLYVPVLCL